MTHLESPITDLPGRITLLREVTELLMWELSVISERRWEGLPALKEKKLLLAERLQKYDWTEGAEPESLDILMLKSQIADLEKQSNHKISARLKMISAQIDALKARHRGWSDCLSSYVAHKN